MDGRTDEAGEDVGAFGSVWRAIPAFWRAVLVIGAAVAVGWASHDRWAEQQGLPGEVDSLQHTVYENRIPSRLQSVEAEVDSLKLAVERRRKELNAIESQLSNLESLAGRILCVVEGNEPCIDPNGSGDG